MWQLLVVQIWSWECSHMMEHKYLFRHLTLLGSVMSLFSASNVSDSGSPMAFFNKMAQECPSSPDGNDTPCNDVSSPMAYFVEMARQYPCSPNQVCGSPTSPYYNIDQNQNQSSKSPEDFSLSDVSSRWHLSHQPSSPSGHDPHSDSNSPPTPSQPSSASSSSSDLFHMEVDSQGLNHPAHSPEPAEPLPNLSPFGMAFKDYFNLKGTHIYYILWCPIRNSVLQPLKMGASFPGSGFSGPQNLDWGFGPWLLAA